MRFIQPADPASELGVRVTAEVQLSPGVYGDWATYSLALDEAAQPEAVSVPAPDGGPPVTGMRRRLQV